MKLKSGLELGMAIGILITAWAGWGGEPAPKPAADKDKAAFQAADTNADNRITREELIQAVSRDAFAKLDKNGDKVVTWEEWAAVDKEPGARERFDAIDAKRNGQITFDEFLEAVRKKSDLDTTFSLLDSDGNGALSQNEYSGLPHFRILSVRF